MMPADTAFDPFQQNRTQHHQENVLVVLCIKYRCVPEQQCMCVSLLRRQLAGYMQIV